MSEDRGTRKSFFTRMFNPEDEGDETMAITPEDVGLEQEPEEPMEKPQGLTVERAAEVIRSIPDEVPYGSAVPIVRLTLEAAGISMEELGTSTRARESKLNSVIEQRQERIKKLSGDTDKAVNYKQQEIQALEDDIKKFRQARDNGISQEEKKISQAESGLEEVDLVRSFFDLPEEEEQPVVEEPAPEEQAPFGQEAETNDDTTSAGEPLSDERDETDADATQILKRPDPSKQTDPDETQVLRRPGPLSEDWNTQDRR